MFTGIITNLGKLTSKEKELFIFKTDLDFCLKIKNGTSVAVNGVCLTVCGKTNNTFCIVVMPETLKKTMLSELKIDSIVNLELPLTPKSFLSGHIVQGHIDDLGKIKSIHNNGNSKIVTIEIPESINKYIVSKGSIAVNGVSLTVISAELNYFTVGIIPYTWEKTMFNQLKINDSVNLETDILGKYMEKLLRKEAKT